MYVMSPKSRTVNSSPNDWKLLMVSLASRISPPHYVRRLACVLVRPEEHRICYAGTPVPVLSTDCPDQASTGPATPAPHSPASADVRGSGVAASVVRRRAAGWTMILGAQDGGGGSGACDPGQQGCGFLVEALMERPVLGGHGGEPATDTGDDLLHGITLSSLGVLECATVSR